MSGGYHPNLIAVPCKDQDDIRQLATEMRLNAIADPDQFEQSESYKGSKTEQEAWKKGNIAGVDLIESGHLRFIYFIPDGKMVNIVFSLMEQEGGVKEWHLSISHGAEAPETPQRVNDDLCKLIIDAFLEKDYQEVEPKAFWKTIRHFVKTANEI